MYGVEPLLALPLLLVAGIRSRTRRAVILLVVGLAAAAAINVPWLAERLKLSEASEGSILVPSDDETELRFLVSMNPALDPSDVTVSVSESVSGYVFSSRQATLLVRRGGRAVA